MARRAARDIVSKLLKFDPNDDIIRMGREQLRDFTDLFPFREKPELIQRLKASDLWVAGERKFFYWLEYGTFNVGHLRIFSPKAYENAGQKLDDFKSLLAVAVDDSETLHEKVDAPWGTIKRFGYDRHIAKKIIALYYPERVFPIFNTDHFEHFADILELAAHKLTERRFGKNYEKATVGEKFEVLNDLLLEWRNGNAPSFDNLALAWFLYRSFPPTRPRGR